MLNQNKTSPKERKILQAMMINSQTMTTVFQRNNSGNKKSPDISPVDDPANLNIVPEVTGNDLSVQACLVLTGGIYNGDANVLRNAN